MEGLNDLLFELSSNERMNIINELKTKRMKLSHVSKKLNITITEASRHMQRLNDAQLIQKDTDGYYKVTQLGTLATNLLSGLNFVTKHKNYFLNYDITGLPYQFINRIGELKDAKYSPETFKNLEEGENKIKEAQEYVWILSDAVLTSSIPILAQKLKKSFDLKIILPEGMFPPENKSNLPSANPNIQKKILPKVNVLIVMTEKYAILCLPNHIGKIDYTCFSGEDPKFHKWCKDLFLHYWQKAKLTTHK